MKPILISAINARHSHASMGARCLLANMGELRKQTDLAEFTIQQSAAEIAGTIAAREPRILGLGVYIWNATRIKELIPLLRQQCPQLKIVLGGPELTEHTPLGTVLMLGEGDLAFGMLCRDLLAERTVERVQIPPPPDLKRIQMPYDEYTDEDLAHRILYVESSRGCAMRCDYCVSANDEAVRYSFNLNIPRAIEILEFFLERIPRCPGLFLHFEMLPDRFPCDLREILSRFPPRSLQLEIGLQSLNPDILERIHRPQNLDRAGDAIRFLREQTHAWLHADLIAGLPGETPESFAAGFDHLMALGPNEIQLGILKKLRGAPIDRHDAEFEMAYDAAPPYEIRSTRNWPPEHLVRTARFAHYWDAIVNSGRFIAAAPLIWKDTPSVFSAFLEFSDWMGDRSQKEHGIPLGTLVEAVFEFLTQGRGIPHEIAADALIRGYRHTGARDIPATLAPYLHNDLPPPTRGLSRALRRQFLHWTWEAPRSKI